MLGQTTSKHHSTAFTLTEYPQIIDLSENPAKNPVDKQSGKPSKISIKHHQFLKLHNHMVRFRRILLHNPLNVVMKNAENSILSSNIVRNSHKSVKYPSKKPAKWFYSIENNKKGSPIDFQDFHLNRRGKC